MRCQVKNGRAASEFWEDTEYIVIEAVGEHSGYFDKR
jgi:hypothetical protein